MSADSWFYAAVAVTVAGSVTVLGSSLVFYHFRRLHRKWRAEDVKERLALCKSVAIAQCVGLMFTLSIERPAPLIVPLTTSSLAANFVHVLTFVTCPHGLL